MTFFRRFRQGLSVVSVLATGAVALAQDYTVTPVTGRWVTPPTTGTTDHGLTGSNQITTVSNLPFPVPYFGRAFTQMGVSSNGYVQFNTSYNAYPYPQLSTWEGFCAPLQSYYYGGNGMAKCRSWVDGVAPNRRFIVAWTNYATQWSSTDTSINLQVQFNESSGRITMAYSGTWTASNSGSNGYAVYIDEAAAYGSRYVRPPNGETSGAWPAATGVYTPPNDWQFDPRITNFTGTIKYDRIVADGTGLGNSVEAGLPLAGLRVELRDAAGNAVGFGTTDANGSYTVKGLALVGSTIGSVAVTARSAACVVRPNYTSPNPPSAPYSFTIATNVAFNSSADLGTYTINAAVDPTGSGRAPLHVARSIQAAYDKVRQLSADALPELEVLYSNSTNEPTTYNRGAGPASASMRVAGPTNANPDAWDTGVVQRTYAHHVLACIAAAQTTPFSMAFDAVTDEENAFAEGFGYYLAALLSGSPLFHDTVNSNTATTVNLETVQPSAPKGANVTAWMAAALYDLLDPANEAWDEADGTGAAGDLPIQVVDNLSTPPTATNFYLKWGEVGAAGTGPLARSFIRHGAISDDAYEANDASTEATAFAAPGFRRSNLTLNPYNEDWFQFQLAEAQAGLAADVSADFPGYGAVVTLEIRDAANALLATGALEPGNILMRAVVPGVSQPGVYRVRVRHDSGGRVNSYIVQAYTPLAMTSGAFEPWTVNRPYNVTLTAKGGVPPYSVTIEQPFVQPPGLLLDSVNLRVTGSPQQVGTQNFVLSVRDDASPPNVASVPQAFVVNPELDLNLGEFMAFPLGRPVDRSAPFTGGTAPHQFTLTSGAAPSGLQLDVATLRFHGTPDTAGSTALHVDGADLAGSTDSAETVAVVAVPFVAGATPVDLATGDSACGFFFDAVQGSVVSVAVKTGKKQAKRALRAVVLDTTGSPMTGPTVKASVGKATISGIQCAATGRYFVILASAAGDPTQLVGTLKLALPKKASGTVANFSAGRTHDVVFGALAGAKATITFKPDKSGLQLRGNLLRYPSGAAIAFQPGELADDGKGGLVFTKDLAESGTWTVSIAAKPGPQGAFTWSLKIVQPKGASYSAD